MEVDAGSDSVYGLRLTACRGWRGARSITEEEGMDSLMAARRKGRGLTARHRMALVPTVLALFALCMLLMASVASATPVEGPEGPAFYEAPETLEGKSGELLRYRPATLNLGVTL